MVDVQKSKVAGTPGRPSASAKISSLIAFTTIVGALSGYLINAGLILYGTFAIVAFLTLLILETLFIEREKLLLFGTFLNALAFALPFFRLVSLYFLVAIFVFSAFLMQGAYMGRREIKNMVKIHFGRIVHVASTSMITAVVLFLSAVLILSSNFMVKKERVDQIVGVLSPVAGKFWGDFTPETQAGELIRQIAERGVVRDERFERLTELQRAAVLSEASDDLEIRFEDYIGADINRDESVSSNVHMIIENKLRSLTPRAQLYWSVLAIAVIWISVRSVEFLVYIPLSLLAFLMYELLFALGFASIQIEQRSKEIISLK